MGSGLRFWPHPWRLRSHPPAGAARSSRRRRRFDPRVYGETCCADWPFDSDRPDRYLQGAGLRAAAGGGPANFSTRRSLTLTGKTPRPGLALHGPSAGSHRECQKGKNNGGNYSEGSVEVVSANALHRPVMQGKSMMKHKKKNGALSLLLNGYRQVARSENKRESMGQWPVRGLLCAACAQRCKAVWYRWLRREKHAGASRRKEVAHTQLQSVLRTIHNCSKFFCATMA